MTNDPIFFRELFKKNNNRELTWPIKSGTRSATQQPCMFDSTWFKWKKTKGMPRVYLLADDVRTPDENSAGETIDAESNLDAEINEIE